MRSNKIGRQRSTNFLRFTLLEDFICAMVEIFKAECSIDEHFWISRREDIISNMGENNDGDTT